MSKSYTDIDIAPLIDHTFLNQAATLEQIAQCCYEAERYNFAAVCVFPCYVSQVAHLLQEKTPKVCTVSVLLVRFCSPIGLIALASVNY